MSNNNNNNNEAEKFQRDTELSQAIDQLSEIESFLAHTELDGERRHHRVANKSSKQNSPSRRHENLQFLVEEEETNYNNNNNNNNNCEIQPPRRSVKDKPLLQHHVQTVVVTPENPQYVQYGQLKRDVRAHRLQERLQKIEDNQEKLLVRLRLSEDLLSLRTEENTRYKTHLEVIIKEIGGRLEKLESALSQHSKSLGVSISAQEKVLQDHSKQLGAIEYTLSRKIVDSSLAHSGAASPRQHELPGLARAASEQYTSHQVQKLNEEVEKLKSSFAEKNKSIEGVVSHVKTDIGSLQTLSKSHTEQLQLLSATVTSVQESSQSLLKQRVSDEGRLMKVEQMEASNARAQAAIELLDGDLREVKKRFTGMIRLWNEQQQEMNKHEEERERIRDRDGLLERGNSRANLASASLRDLRPSMYEKSSLFGEKERRADAHSRKGSVFVNEDSFVRTALGDS